MGNLITNEKNGEYLQLSNGGTAVLISVLLLSASDVAQTQWENDFTAWLAGHDQSLLGLGMIGFDLNDIAWSNSDFQQQKIFLLKVIHKAMKKHRWSVLGYEPPYVGESLVKLRDMVNHFQQAHIGKDREWGQLQFKADPPRKCSKHAILEHVTGCYICLDN